MNCKPGDLAIVVGDRARHHNGKVVRCISRDMEGERRLGVAHWNVDPELIDPNGLRCIPADVHLRPIRPGDITDKEVRDLYLPKLPEKEHA